MAEKNITLLCVADDLNALFAMRHLFRPKGFRVLIAESFDESLEEIKANPEIKVLMVMLRESAENTALFFKEIKAHSPEIIRVLLGDFENIDAELCLAHWNDETLFQAVYNALQEKKRLLSQQQSEELKAAHEKIKKTFLTTLKIFSHLIELRNADVAGHSKRVADLARKIGVEMGVDHKGLNDIFLAGLLHDIGKIGFADNLLKKAPIKMSAEERGVYCQHPVKGEQLLLALEELHNAAHLIRHHHEHFAGTGYPDRLAGEQIPLGARILALANEFDGLTQGYLTGKKQTILEVRDYIQKDNGKRYDPKVVAAFFEVMWPQSAITQEVVAAVDTFSAEESSAPKVVTIAIQALKPGMKLSRDLFGGDGVMLLAADFVLDAVLIDKLLEYVAQHGGKPKMVEIYEPESPPDENA